MPNLTRTNIEIVAPVVRWASVRVIDRKTGEILSEWRITADEEFALREKHVLPNSIAKGLWEDQSKLVVVSGRHLVPGQAVEMADGSLVVQYGSSDTPNRVNVDIAQLFPGEWDKDVDQKVRVRSDKVQELTEKWQGKPPAPSPSSPRPTRG